MSTRNAIYIHTYAFIANKKHHGISSCFSPQGSSEVLRSLQSSYGLTPLTCATAIPQIRKGPGLQALKFIFDYLSTHILKYSTTRF